MNFLTKLLFLISRPQLIIVTGNGRSGAAEAIFQVLKNNNFSVKKISQAKGLFWVSGNYVLIFESAIKKISEASEMRFLARRAKKTILVASSVGEVPADEYFFAAEKEDVKEIAALVGCLPVQSRLILNFDDETVRELKAGSQAPVFTFGFQKGADFQASDVNISQKGTNFKINEQGNIVPVWLKNLFGKEQIYSALAGVVAGLSLDINLVEASQGLRSYQSLPGRMRLIKAVKDSQLLDDSQNASSQSMAEALDVLAKIPAERRIAVLGDILEVGKYAMAAHQALGQRAAKCCDLLFTIGARARFIAEGARETGLSQENIFCFDEVEQGAKALEQKIKPGDLILIDGSAEMHLAKVVEEVRGTN